MGELTPEERPDPAGGYGKKVTAVMIGLKTTKGTKTLKLAPQIYESLQKEKVTVGDVIYIEANSGVSKRVGRSDAYATEFDLEADEYVPVPKGDVHKKKEIVQDVTLHDLDRLVIIRTLPYSVDEITQVVSIRSQTEGLEIEEEALAMLGE